MLPLVPLFTSFLLPMIGGIWILWYSLSYLGRQTYLRRKGIKTQGIIVDFSNEEYISHGLEEELLPYPIIRFETKEGEWITERYIYATHSNMKLGDKVQVWYDAGDPHRFYIYTWHIDTILGSLGVLGGIGLIGYGLYNLIKYLWS